MLRGGPRGWRHQAGVAVRYLRHHPRPYRHRHRPVRAVRVVARAGGGARAFATYADLLLIGRGAPNAPHLSAANQGGLMRIAVLSETEPVETRVAATPDVVKKYKSLGADVVVQAGAGARSGMPDAEFEAAGA